jgi:hypothetical protein
MVGIPMGPANISAKYLSNMRLVTAVWMRELCGHSMPMGQDYPGTHMGKSPVFSLNNVGVATRLQFMAMGHKLDHSLGLTRRLKASESLVNWIRV